MLQLVWVETKEPWNLNVRTTLTETTTTENTQNSRMMNQNLLTYFHTDRKTLWNAQTNNTHHNWLIWFTKLTKRIIWNQLVFIFFRMKSSSTYRWWLRKHAPQKRLKSWRRLVSRLQIDEFNECWSDVKYLFPTEATTEFQWKVFDLFTQVRRCSANYSYFSRFPLQICHFSLRT